MRTIEEQVRLEPWMLELKRQMLQTCGDCGAGIGEPHQPGCDLSRCATCGGQRVSCACAESGPMDEWTGIPMPELHHICIEEELYCHCRDAEGIPIPSGQAIGLPGAKFHVPCRRDDPFSYEDLNRAAYLLMRSKARIGSIAERRTWV